MSTVSEPSNNTQSSTGDKGSNLSQESADRTAENKSSRHVPPGQEDQDGYEFFPQRFGRKENTLFDDLTSDFFGRKRSRQVKCIANVYWCMRNNTTVRLLAGALKSHGCPFKWTRHITCEECFSRVNGGYDPYANQVVICQNNSKKYGMTCGVLAHEMLHMFDNCRAEVNFLDLEHLACTEIRAANLMHCSFMSAWMVGTASPFKFKNQHKECVRQKALMSVLIAREVTREEGEAAVDKVFDRCYNDMEPIGRRVSDGPAAINKAVTEAYLYGYTDWTSFNT